MIRGVCVEIIEIIRFFRITVIGTPRPAYGIVNIAKLAFVNI